MIRTHTNNSLTNLPPLRLPSAPSLVAVTQGAIWISEDGEIEQLESNSITARLSSNVCPYVCNARSLARRMGIGPFKALDVLELFAFVHPAEFCLPTPRGLAQALDLPIPIHYEDEANSLTQITAHLLEEATIEAIKSDDSNDQQIAIARVMEHNGWSWGHALSIAIGRAYGSSSIEKPADLKSGLKVWSHLTDWEDTPISPPAETQPVKPKEARDRLAQLLGNRAENRIDQVSYSSTVSNAFLPREKKEKPNIVIAEAGTGIGKTLGYLAPASIWAEKNKGTVWISTFTRNLQRQLDAELDHLYPVPEEKAVNVVVRKGRENYLCLLNFEETVNSISNKGSDIAIPLGLMARWILASHDGDMVGGDFPSWLIELLGKKQTIDLTDTRGECTYSACSHYKRCFIEKSQRRTRHAKIVVANHALIMIQAILASGDDAGMGAAPTRYVFDEGHQIFDAADSAFASHLTGSETAELRQWLIGSEAIGRSRSRGLRSRVNDLISNDDRSEQAVGTLLKASRMLPAPGWLQRITANTPNGSAEEFLSLVRQQVYARNNNSEGTYSLEADTTPQLNTLLEVAKKFEEDLSNMIKPMNTLIQGLLSILDQNADSLDTSSRNRIEAIVSSIQKRGLIPLHAWVSMLATLDTGIPNKFVDLFNVERWSGIDQDIGFHRHWIDPTEPFAKFVIEPSHGVVMTSATLRDKGPEEEDFSTQANESNSNACDPWSVAMDRTGVNYLASPVIMKQFPSPFNYAVNTQVLIIGDVRRNAQDQVASAYRALFQASGGGGLGLFTAISRLRDVQERIVVDLDKLGIPLLAQHVDPLDTGTLIDIFRAEEKTCLLGTDAVRDGVDIPGRSLRLIVFDRVPWPRPDIIHRARRNHFGERTYDDMLTRLKLKQAFGRLVRGHEDKGIFVILDKAVPSRLLNAFPEGVKTIRCGLSQAIETVQDFFNLFDTD